MKIISSFIYFFLTAQLVFAQTVYIDIHSYIATARLNNPHFEDNLNSVHLRYLYYNPQDKDFKILLDKEDARDTRNSLMKKVAKELIGYFLTGVSLPNSSFWVNLRPDTPDNIIDGYLAQTEAGKILLEADLQLKKDTARFTSPETPEGKEYWGKLYKKAEEIFGYQNVTIPTLTRPWIVPCEIIARDSQDSLYIYKATLKVMLEQDYLKNSATYNFKDERLRQLNEYSSELIRELIIPKLTKEINSSRRYAPLRQVYYSLIFAQWFKEQYASKNDGYSSLIDRRNIAGVRKDFSEIEYFNEYQKSFKNGEYNIQEPVYTPYGQTIRSYFSGGVAFQNMQRSSSPAAGPIKEIPNYTTTASINGNPDNFEVRMGNMQTAVMPEKAPPIMPSWELTDAEKLAGILSREPFDKQSQESALRILDYILQKEGWEFNSGITNLDILNVTRQIFLRPDTLSEELADRFCLTQEKLICVYRILRASETLQDLIVEETKYSRLVNCTVKYLLRYSDRLERAFNNQVVYPVVVEWHPGETCDSNCIFCYNKGLNYKEQGRRQTLSIKRSKELLKEFADNNVREFWVSGGKEPLTNPMTADVIQYATDLGLTVKLYTNGIRLVSSVQQKLLNCQWVRISLNAAVSKTYKEVQGIDEKNFYAVTKNIGDLVKLRNERGSSLNIGMSFLVNPSNYKEILQIADIAKKLGVDFLALNSEMAGTIRRFTDEEIDNILKSVEKLKLNQELGLYGKLNIDIRSLTREDLKGEKHFLPDMERAKMCRIKNIKMNMNPYGVCYLCDFAGQPRNERKEVELGDVNKMSFREILRSNINVKYETANCDTCLLRESGFNIFLEKFKADKEFGIPLEEQPYRAGKENEIEFLSKKNKDSNEGNIMKNSIKSSSPIGGIDFRSLPISRQIIGELADTPPEKLRNIDLNRELGEAETLVDSGIVPSEDRIKELLKVSNYQGIYSRRLMNCIIDTLRLQEKNYAPTEESLKDILSFLN